MNYSKEFGSLTGRRKVKNKISSRLFRDACSVPFYTLIWGTVIVLAVCDVPTSDVTATSTNNLIQDSIPSIPNSNDNQSDIYVKVIEFLVSKRTRLQQQRVLHNRLLEQYKSKITHPGVVNVRVSDENSRYSILSLSFSSPNNSSQIHEIGRGDVSIPHKRSSNDRSRSRHALDDGQQSPLLKKQMEIDNLANQVVDMTLNDTSTGRAQGGRSLGVSSIFSKFSSVLDLSRVVREIETSVMSSVSCSACRAGVGLLNHYIQSGRKNAEIAAAATKLCINLKMQTLRVCSGIVNLYVDEIVEVLKGVVLDSNDICALVIGESCGEPVGPNWRWSVDFPPIPKPPFNGFPEPKKNAPKLKVLQISDTHWDPYYEPGSNADCGEPLCCRISSGPLPPRPHLGAGIWGDYRKCDTPRNTMESMFEHISQAHNDIDYIIWTGDIPAHDIWNQTRETNMKMIKETVDMFTQYFPHIPVFPALGNHEPSPVNSFAPPWVTDPKFSPDWLYEELQKDWSRWLPDTTQSTIREGAFYSTIIKPGFKLISLNMNYCNNKNWWLLVNSTDPVDELKWLIFELQSSELAHERVHIIGHIPPGHADCMATWSRNYYDIVSRYESTIAAQFFGHTHYDEMEIFYPKEDPYRAASVAYVGPSVTPYYNLNPGYRIYYVDGDYSTSTRSVVDHETWVTDLGEANRIRASHLTWYKLYSAKEAYGLESLNPIHWDDLVMSMYNNRHLFNQYYRFYNKNSPVAPDCDEECKSRLLCDIRSGRSHSREELCKPRPVHVRISRGGLAERPQSKISQIFIYISSAFSSIMGYIKYPFGY